MPHPEPALAPSTQPSNNLGDLQHWASQWVLEEKTYFHSHLMDETAPRGRSDLFQTVRMSSNDGETHQALVLDLKIHDRRQNPLLLLAHTPGVLGSCRSTKRFSNSPAILSPYLSLHFLSFSALPGSRRGRGPEISCERLLHSTFLVAEEILYSGDFLLPVTSVGTKGPKAEQVPEQGKELGLTCPGALGTGGGPSLARSN